MTLPLAFESSFDRAGLARRLSRLAEQGIFVGTSSWKYAGWRGQLYDEARYVYRGKFSESRFERLCLSEYAEVFKTVCVDAAYYQFPSTASVNEWMDQVPSDFQFTLKVTDEITVKRFPNLPRFGPRAGEVNPHFLNAELFVSDFLGPFENHREKVGVLIFEFSRFNSSDFARGRDFVGALGDFLERLPKGWRYGVEVRNRNFLEKDYFAMLRQHGAAHVFNSWDAMPSIGEQMEMSGSLTVDFVPARLLLKPGRKYEDAVKSFSPYDRIRDAYPEGRAAAARILRESMVEHARRKVFLYVNNRFEGNALETIVSVLAQAGVTES
jgi:uncharacterized protein YecE (DUF72 family)